MNIMQEMEDVGERYLVSVGEEFAIGVARCVCLGIPFREWDDFDDVQRGFAQEHTKEILRIGLEQWRDENHDEMGDMVALETLGGIDEHGVEILRELRETLDLLQRANDLVNYERVLLRNPENKPIHALLGRSVAHITTQRDHSDRWMELELYRLKGGGFKLREIGQTTILGERQLNTFTDYADEQELIDDRGHDNHSLRLYDQAMIYTVEI